MSVEPRFVILGKPKKYEATYRNWSAKRHPSTVASTGFRIDVLWNKAYPQKELTKFGINLMNVPRLKLEKRKVTDT